jgi:hypothetical protein
MSAYKAIFKRTVEPSEKSGVVVLNPDAKMRDPTFRKVQNDKYISTDSRLISGTRMIQVPLNKPPYESNVTPETMYVANPTKPQQVGGRYASYQDINSGQIRYFVNREYEDTYFNPLFVTKATAVGTKFVDPMGSNKPEFNRVPLTSNNPITNPAGEPRGVLSWISDSTAHREDLLALQMRKGNQSRWQSINTV